MIKQNTKIRRNEGLPPFEENNFYAERQNVPHILTFSLGMPL